ncbi:MAG: hypothetical protein IT379_11600 [Deltaproteobacteria bacterium]|nr:hypothetical protein [Deltaproteobacteria bacterium]
MRVRAIGLAGLVWCVAGCGDEGSLTRVGSTDGGSRDASSLDGSAIDGALPSRDGGARVDGTAPALDATPPDRDGAAPPADARPVDEGSDAGPDEDAAIPPVCSDPEPSRRRLFGMNVDLANPGGSPSADELAAAGVRWVRVEWKADPGYPLYDDAMAALRSAGIRVLLLVDYASVPGKPASDASDGEWESYLATFVAGAGELGRHYGDSVDAWQLWNEPDLFDPGGPYDPGVPERHLGALLRDAAAAIRASSVRPVVTAGLASGDPGYLQRAIDATGELTVDAIAVHPYGQRAPDGWPDPSWGFGEMSDLFDRYLAFGLPLWVSEIGTIDEPIAAEYLTNVYALAGGEHAGRVQVVFWFCWSDAMVPPFGIHAADGASKASYDSYRSAAPPWDPACDHIE